LIALAAVGAAVWMAIARGRAIGQAEAATARAEALTAEVTAAREQLARTTASAAETERDLRAQIEARSEELSREKQELARLGERVVALEGDLVQADQAHRARVQDIERRHDEALKASQDHFKRLAGDVLAQTVKEFQERASQQFSGQREHLALELEQKRKNFDELLSPIRELLAKTDTNLARIEQERTASFASLVEQIRGTQESSAKLKEETGKLVAALRKPQVRGRYGEVQLRRVVEIAGLRNYCDFSEQDSRRTDAGDLQRPDMTIKLPSERTIVIDAKTNIDAYLDALEAASPEAAEHAMDRFAEHVCKQVEALSAKAYWDQFERTPEFVVMFVPGDQFIDGALSRRPELFERAAERRVILASPSTLIGLLRAVELGWREQRLAEEAEELRRLGRELHERASVAWEHASKLGASLRQSAEHYNRFVASVDARLTPTLRKFEDAGAKSSKEMHVLQEVTVIPKALESASGSQGV
jgi:DNA recombination protein RmuC